MRPEDETKSKRNQPPYRDAEGNLHLPINDVDPLCDFCCYPDAVPTICLLCQGTTPISVFPVPGGGTVSAFSNGEWYCCRICLDMILTKDRDGLADRTIARQLQEYGLPRHMLSQAVLELRDSYKRIHAGALDQLEGWPE